MNQYKLGQLGKVWSMMSRHPEVLFKRYSHFRNFLEVFRSSDTRFSIHPARTRKFRWPYFCDCGAKLCTCFGLFEKNSMTSLSCESHVTKILKSDSERTIVATLYSLYYEKEWYSNQKPIKIGWVCAVVYCVLKKGDINLRTRWQNRRGHQSPFSENYVKSTMNYIIIHYLYILIYRLGSLGNTPRIQSKASWFKPRWWLYLALVISNCDAIGRDRPTMLIKRWMINALDQDLHTCYELWNT